jgi:hypothetical protein
MAFVNQVEDKEKLVAVIKNGNREGKITTSAFRESEGARHNSKSAETFYSNRQVEIVTQ